METTAPKPTPTPAPSRKGLPTRVRVAIIILGITGLLQVGAAAWSFASRIDLGRRSPAPVTETAGGGEAATTGDGNIPASREEAALDALEEEFLSRKLIDLEASASAGPATAASGRDAGTTGTMPRYDAAGIIDPEAAALVAQGIKLRESGDTLGALDHFRAAINQLPEHPRILYELGTTYDLMGLTARGAEFWEKLYLLGDIAGEFHRIADFKLRGGDESGPLSPNHQPLVISDVRTIRESGPDAPDGERLQVQIGLRSRPDTFVDHSKVETHVFFFDVVNGFSVDQSTAQPPTARWITGPAVDWMESGEEILEVTYHQAPMSDTERRDLGSRAYYGYVIKLYYENQLVDQTAEPRTLFDRQLPRPDQPRLDGSLFPDH